jgi:hypothetical protein
MPFQPTFCINGLFVRAILPPVPLLRSNRRPQSGGNIRWTELGATRKTTCPQRSAATGKREQE